MAISDVLADAVGMIETYRKDDNYDDGIERELDVLCGYMAAMRRYLDVGIDTGTYGFSIDDLRDVLGSPEAARTLYRAEIREADLSRRLLPPGPAVDLDVKYQN